MALLVTEELLAIFWLLREGESLFFNDVTSSWSPCPSGQSHTNVHIVSSIGTQRPINNNDAKNRVGNRERGRLVSVGGAVERG